MARQTVLLLGAAGTRLVGFVVLILLMGEIRRLDLDPRPVHAESI